MFLKLFSRQKAIHLLRENGPKHIKDSIFNDQVRSTCIDFIRLNKNPNVMVIGGIAYGVHLEARSTQDLDIIVVSDSDIDSVFENIKSKFKHNRLHSFEHKSTGVEVEVLTPSFINYDPEIVKSALADAQVHDLDGHKIKVVSPKYLIVLKLKRASGTNSKARQDQHDIMELIQRYGAFDLSDVGLSEKELKTYSELIKDTLE